MNEYIDVIVPDGACGDWRIETFNVSEDDARLIRLRASITNRDNYVPAGTYKRLMHGSTLVMSNTPMEVRTHRDIIHQAQGRVLINGLGLGMVLTAILFKPEVESVTVVEVAPEVIDLVGSSFDYDPRVRIIHADAMDYQPAKGERFEAVWHDIWNHICADNLPAMHKLHRKYAHRADWQASWCRKQCEMQRKRIPNNLLAIV